MGDYDPSLDRLIGKKVSAIGMNEEFLVFLTSDGSRIGYTVEGDCCSHSYFYDFVGADKLLFNGPVLEFNPVSLPDPDDGDEYDVIQAYGFEIVTKHFTWGEQTSVLSFRNSSNGYYGGWMCDISQYADMDQIMKRLTEVKGPHFEVSALSA